MTGNIAYYVLLLLDQYGTVRIPGLGQFVQGVEGASLDKTTDTIAAPGAKTIFNPGTEGSDELLVQFISYKSGISRRDAQRLVKDFVERVVAQASGGIVEVHGLGQFTAGGGVMQFYPDQSVENCRFAGLPDVALANIRIAVAEQESVASPVVQVASITASNIEEAKPPESAPVQDPDPVAEQPRRRIPLIVPLFLLAFAAVTVLAVMQYKSRNALMHPASTFNRTPITDSAGQGSGGDINQEVIPEDVEVTDSAEDADPGSVDAIEPPAVAESRLPRSHGSNSEEEHKITLNNEEVESVVANPERSVGTDASVSNATSDCYVIVGVFGNPANVDRMMELLKSKGHTPTTLLRGELTQVGIGKPCRSAEIKSTLEELRNSVEPSAWIFKPK